MLPGSGRYGVGEGVFDVVGCRQQWLRPLLRLTGGEEAFFPEYGERIPFRIENHAHLDPFGRSSLTARREIHFPGRTRLFHDTTIRRVHDGDTRRWSTMWAATAALPRTLNLAVTPEGRLRGVSGASRFFLGPLRIPLPAALDAKAYAEQWWDPSAGGHGKHRIQVKVIQPQLGLVLVYAGCFDYRLRLLPRTCRAGSATSPAMPGRSGGRAGFSRAPAGSARPPPGSVGSGQRWRTTACTPASPSDGVTRIDLERRGR